MTGLVKILDEELPRTLHLQGRKNPPSTQMDEGKRNPFFHYDLNNTTQFPLWKFLPFLTRFIGQIQ